MIKQAVILAGGLGTRLGTISKSTPKPLLRAGNRPFLEYLIWNLRRHGIRDILLSVGYLAEKIIEYFGDGRRLGVSLDYAVEPEPAGTGGALLLGRPKLNPGFFVINGDTLFDINYLDLAILHELEAAAATVALRSICDSNRYGTVGIEGNKITGFFEKTQAGPGLINGGIYAMQREALDYLKPPPCSLEHDLFPPLADKGLLAGRVYDGFFIDIGQPETLKQSGILLPSWIKKPAVFFDRDGVLNIDHSYIHCPEDFVWVDGAPEAIKWCNDRGHLVIVVTNQSGIGRGYYSEECFLSFTNWINDELRRIAAHIDATYYCPHHPESAVGNYKRICNCRKPAPGLVLRAMRDWNVDKVRSVLIGDKESDIVAAESAGIRGVLFKGGSVFDLVIKEVR